METLLFGLGIWALAFQSSLFLPLLFLLPLSADLRDCLLSPVHALQEGDVQDSRSPSGPWLREWESITFFIAAMVPLIGVWIFYDMPCMCVH